MPGVQGPATPKPTPRAPEPYPGRYDVKIPQVLRIDPLDELGKASIRQVCLPRRVYKKVHIKRSHLGLSENSGKTPKMDGFLLKVG